MIWVICFPWTNCETETNRALNDVWLEAEIFLWNEDEKVLSDLDWYVIAWGFSFEDRWRSWVIASTYPIIEILREASRQWKPILWICNWAQILVESWLLTDSIWPRIALSENKRIDKDWNLLWTWFYNTWTFLKPNKEAKTSFNDFDELMQIPLAHAEWRFLIPNCDDVLVVFQYTDENWNVDSHFPINPNWSDFNSAWVSNLRWNVMAIMPHPERIEDGYNIFRSLDKYIKNWKYETLKDGKFKDWKTALIKQKEIFDIEIYIKLIITDNEAVSIKNAIESKVWVSDFNLSKYRFYWINKIGEDDFKILDKLIFSWELLNFEKETLFLKKWNIFYKYLKWNKKEILDNFEVNWLRVRNYDDIDSLEIKEIFDRFWISAGIVTWKQWFIDNKQVSEQTLKTNILANWVSQFVEA